MSEKNEQKCPYINYNNLVRLCSAAVVAAEVGLLVNGVDTTPMIQSIEIFISSVAMVFLNYTSNEAAGNTQNVNIIGNLPQYSNEPINEETELGSVGVPPSIV